MKILELSFFSKLEQFDSSVVAWEYEYITTDGNSYGKKRMNTTNLTFQLPEGIYLSGSIKVRTFNNFGIASNDVVNTGLVTLTEAHLY